MGVLVTGARSLNLAVMSSSNSGPGYAKNPAHKVSVQPFDGRVVVELNGEVLVDTRAALRLDEGTYPAVYYVPRADTQMGRLERTDRSTHCPFKGDASYYSITGYADNVVWSYEAPYDEVAVIGEHLAFYPDKVTIRVTPADAST